MTQNSDHTLIPTYPLRVYQILIKEGFTKRQLLDCVDFRLRDLEDQKYRLSIEQHKKFLANAIALTNNPHLALLVAEKYDSANAGVVALAALNSKNISSALELIARYDKYLMGALTISSLDFKNKAVIEIEPLVDDPMIQYFALSSFALVMDKLFSTVIKDEKLFIRAEFSVEKPAGFNDIAEKINFPISFKNSRNRLFLNKHILEQNIDQSDPQTVRILIEILEKLDKEDCLANDLVSNIQFLLIDHISSPPSLEEVSIQLGMSSRSLRRKLQLSDTTYQKILDNVRLDLAKNLINGTSKTMQSIAYELGFDDASNFGRAFKKWTGVTPASFRAK